METTGNHLHMVVVPSVNCSLQGLTSARTVDGQNPALPSKRNIP